MARGTLRIYLGASPGVGKTYKMLGEGVRRLERGTDVVIGIVETHARAQTAAQIRELEVVPLREIVYRGATIKEMDVDAVLRRRPQVVLVDEYAHTNAPGSRHEKRWQDVEVLLDAGIDVISTLNIQHLESLNDVIFRITGVSQRETVPDDVVRRADQLELVDMTPEAIRRRLADGNIYPAERIDAAMANYFRVGNLGALRELALLWVADRVEESLHSYLEANGIADTWETRERVVVGLTGRPGSDALIRRASRMASRSRGDLLGVHVVVDDGLARDDSDALAAQQRLVLEVGGTVHEVVGHDAADALVAFARREKATQLVLGASRRSRWHEITRGSFVSRVTRLAGTIDVHVIHDESASNEVPWSPKKLRITPTVTRQRRIAAWLLTLVGLPMLIAMTLPFREDVAISTELLVVLVLVLAIAVLGGLLVGSIAAVLASLLVNWYFVQPYNTLTIAEGENVVALAVFVVVAITVGKLVVTVSQKSSEGGRARLEARALAVSATTLAADPDPIPELLEQVRTIFGLNGARIAVSTESATDSSVAVGDVSGASSASIPMVLFAGTETHALELFGPPLSGDDHELLMALSDQLAVALERRRLAEEADEADELSAVDAVRTALLRAVSHDLRTPLASIKAMISGLRDPTVHWTQGDIEIAQATIEEETDRLNQLVGNLLDASRLQIGAMAVDVRPTDVGSVIAAAARATTSRTASDIEFASSQPEIVAMADPILLERALDNVIANAVRHGQSDHPIRVDAAVVGRSVVIRVIDRGPGVPMADRAKVVQPFQRLGDGQAADGVGLGLSISQGFIQAMHGEFSLEDTPGGGLTVTVRLLLADDCVTP